MIRERRRKRRRYERNRTHAEQTGRTTQMTTASIIGDGRGDNALWHRGTYSGGKPILFMFVARTGCDRTETYVKKKKKLINEMINETINRKIYKNKYYIYFHEIHGTMAAAALIFLIRFLLFSRNIFVSEITIK